MMLVSENVCPMPRKVRYFKLCVSRPKAISHTFVKTFPKDSHKPSCTMSGLYPLQQFASPCNHVTYLHFQLHR